MSVLRRHGDEWRRNMKKRLLVFVAACSMMISMTGCGGSDKKETTAEVEINEPTKTVAEDDTTEGNTAEPDVKNLFTVLYMAKKKKTPTMTSL